MDTLSSIGKLLIAMGAAMLLLGLVLTLASRLPFLGRLPGDILVQHDGFTFFFPLATMILLSVVLTVLLNVLPRLFR